MMEINIPVPITHDIHSKKNNADKHLLNWAISNSVLSSVNEIS
jgi:hypothetical protein